MSETEITLPLHRSLMRRIRAYFFAGVLVTAPISITFYITWAFLRAVDDWVSPLIPPQLNSQIWGIPGFGLVMTVLTLTLIGALTAGFVGRLFTRFSEAVLGRMPVISSIYGTVKQVLETMLANKANALREVALIQYPHPGSWTLGFITGATSGEVQGLFEQEMVNVFVPTTPNPTSGFLLIVPKSAVKILSISVEEGFKMLISMGMITPEKVTKL